MAGHDQNRFLADPEPILGTLARMFAADGAAREVAVLTFSTPDIAQTGYDNWDGGQNFYTLTLYVRLTLFTQLQDNLEAIEKAICEKAQILLKGFSHDHLAYVKIVPATVEDPEWRDKAARWLAGEGVSNQGRVRSQNVAPLSVDGLLFRSQAEVHLYRALKPIGVSFAPLPVFIRGGATYRRIEPDFFLVHGGIALVVEVDGDTVHEETPVEAHARTSMLQHEGVHVERVKSSDCDTAEKAARCAERIMAVIEKIRAAR